MGASGPPGGPTGRARCPALEVARGGYSLAMATATDLGKAGLQGWREKVGEGMAGPVASKTPLDEDQVRAAVGALFFVLAVLYVVKTLTDASQRVRKT